MKHILTKGKIAPIIAFTILSIIILIKNEYTQILSQLQSVHWGWISISLLLILLYWVFEAKSLHLFIKAYDEEYAYSKVFKLVLSTQFFNGITPFSSGGQPFQIYALSKESKFSIGHSTSLSTHNFIVYQIALVLLGSITLILGHFSYAKIYINASANFFTVIGFILNLLIIVSLCAIALSSKISHRLLHSILLMLKPFSCAKKQKKRYKKWKSLIADFHHEIHYLLKNKRLFALTILLNIFKLMSFYTIAYFILLSLDIYPVSFLRIILASSYVMLITSIVPLPGASGGAEGGFFLIFSTFLLHHHITSVILIWRFITYYLGLIIGFISYTFFHRAKNYA
jgi:hypothetical protein